MFSVIIPAAGSGSRTSLGYNKLLYKFGNITILEKTISAFFRDDVDKIIIATSKEDFDEINIEENEKEIKNKQMNEEKIKTNQEIELIEDTINLNNNSPLNNVIDLNIKNKKYKNILNKSKKKKENKLLILEDKKENIENN